MVLTTTYISEVLGKLVRFHPHVRSVVNVLCLIADLFEMFSGLHFDQNRILINEICRAIIVLNIALSDCILKMLFTG